MKERKITLHRCENDPFLLRNLNYTQVSARNPTAHLVVQQEAHAFKFADRVVVNFQCSIMLDIQRDGQCPVGVITNPNRRQMIGSFDLRTSSEPNVRLSLLARSLFRIDSPLESNGTLR